MQLGDEAGDSLRVQLLDGNVTEARKQPAERHSVGLHGASGHVDAGGLPAGGEHAKRRRLSSGGEAKLGNTATGELAVDPAAPLVRLPLRLERASVTGGALPAT